MTVAERPEIVTLCGSTRFKADFERESRRLGLEGKIVLSVSMFGHSGDLTPEQCADGHPTKTALDELHKRKIDLADRVLVINPDGYLGASTRSEIRYDVAVLGVPASLAAAASWRSAARDVHDADALRRLRRGRVPVRETPPATPNPDGER